MTRKKLKQVMTREKLETAISSVDWNANISEFVKETSLTETIANCNLRLAVWSKQFEETDKENPALSFVREMQIAGHHTADPEGTSGRLFMSDYSKLNLKGNPFSEIPPYPDQEDGGNLIWAGLPLLREKIENIHQAALTSDVRQVILNWGTVGAGKTYSAFYFSNENRIKSVVPEYEGDIFHIYARIPKNGNDATQQLFKEILDSFSLSRIRSQIQLMIQDVGRENLLRFLSQRIRSEEFSKAILLLGNQDSEISEIMSRYLFGNTTNAELKKIRLVRHLESAGDYARMLAGIFMFFTDTRKGRLFIWLDETEDLLFLLRKNIVCSRNF